MKGNLRIVLYALAAGLVFMLWQRWQIANQPQVPPEQTASAIQQTASDGSNRTPAFDAGGAAGQTPVQSGGSGAAQAENLVHVKTDLFDLTISSEGATIVNAKLLDFKESVDDPKPLALLHRQNPARMLFESGIVSSDGTAMANHLTPWKSDKAQYVLADGQDELRVPFHWRNADGTTVTKTYIFHRGQYKFTLDQTISVGSGSAWQGFAYQQFAFGQAADLKGLGHVATFTGGVSSTPDDRYNKIKLSDISNPENGPLDATTDQGWVAMMQHYFIGAIVPKAGQPSKLYTQYDSGDHIIGVHGMPVTVAPGQTHQFSDTVYIGPKTKKNLDQVAPYLDKTVDYGYLFMISQFMFKVMNVIHSVVGNWGWAIIFMTLLIKLIFFIPSAWAYKSMAKMRALQPQMAQLKERYGDDRQAMGQEMMKLYKKEKVNPASGCLPMLLQIPFFIAFYWVLAESVELRQAPWLGWIQDLSAMDPYFILPVLNATLMFLQQKLNPPPPDPMQAKVMMMLPLIFGFMFMWFPSGLVLYWTVSNAFSIVQQYIMNKRYGTPQRPHNHHKHGNEASA